LLLPRKPVIGLLGSERPHNGQCPPYQDHCAPADLLDGLDFIGICRHTDGQLNPKLFGEFPLQA
jgi:hypothetical protein